MTVPSYPGYPGAAPAPKKRPTIVTVAMYLLFLGAFLELVIAIVGFSVYPKISDAIKEAYAGTDVEGAEDLVAVSSIIGAVINLLFAAGLAVLGFLDGRGRFVARIITWIVGGLSLCCVGGGLGSNALVSSVNSTDTTTGGPSSAEVQERLRAALPSWYEGTNVTLSVVLLLAMLAVIILLALPASNEFFRKRPAGFDPYYPGGYSQPGYPGGGQPGAYSQPPYPGQSPYPASGQSPYPAPQQPGGYGQPGQPAPGLPPYPGGPGTPPPVPGGLPPYPGAPAQPPFPGQPGPTGSPAQPPYPGGPGPEVSGQPPVPGSPHPGSPHPDAPEQQPPADPEGESRPPA